MELLTWLLEALLDELTEELPVELPELEPPAPGVCCATSVTEINRVTARPRPESLIKHLLTDSGEWDKIFVVLLHSDATVLAKVNLKQRLGTH